MNEIFRFLTMKRSLLAVGGLLLGGLLISITATAQPPLHGVGVQKTCFDSKVGDVTNCFMAIENNDDLGDNIAILEAFDTVETNGGPVRVPLVGDLPIINIEGNAACTDGPSLPCTVGPDIGDGVGRVIFQQNQYVIQPDDPNPLPDTFSARVQDQCDGTPDNNCSVQEVVVPFPAQTNIFAPVIDVTKEADREFSKVGDTINYTITLINNSDPGIPDLICTATDSLVGVIFGPDVLPVGSLPIDVPYVVPDGATGSVENTVTLSCSPDGFGNIFEDTASETVALFEATIDVTKEADREVSKVGDTINYSINLINNSGPGTPNLICTATDSLVGVIFGPDVLPVGSLPIDVPYVVPDGATGSVENTVTLNCSPHGFPNVLDDSASETVALFEAAIDVTKEADREVSKVGDTINYSINLINNSGPGTPNLICTATDSLVGVIFGPDVLPVGSLPIDVPYVVPDGATGSVENTVTLNCSPHGFPNVLDDSASETVALFEVAIDVTKEADREISKVGDTINYSINLINNSGPGTPNLICTATDSLVGVIFGPDVLPVGSLPIDVPYVVPDGATGSVENTVTLNCSPDGFPNVLDDSASETVALFEAAIDVTKEADREISKVGDTINYSINLINNSGPGTPNLICTATDSLVGVIFGPDVLPVGSLPIDVPYVVPDGAAGSVENTVTLSCSPHGFPNALDDSASETVRLVDPDFTITKICEPDPVPVGGTINWTISLENTGDAALEICVNDPVANIAEGSPDMNDCRILGPGEGDTINASSLVDAADAPSIDNVATATAMLANSGLPNVIERQATASCEVVVNEAICRTPGFWGTHAGTEKNRSQNITQAVIDAGGGSLSICGQTIDNTLPGNPNSAVEAMCVKVQGDSRRQLARQLTAAALNCIVSGAGADCVGLPAIADTFATCNANCLGGDISGCIEAIDAFNNGLTIPGCHDEPLENDVLNLDFNPPGPAGSSQACRAANNNDIIILPLP